MEFIQRLNSSPQVLKAATAVSYVTKKNNKKTEELMLCVLQMDIYNMIFIERKILISYS